MPSTVARKRSEENFFGASAAARYAGETFRFLFPPEQTILTYLKGQGLETMSMLDLGVGGGRTTEHFAPLVARYIAVDYSQAMVKASRDRFQGRLPEDDFIVADARNLSMFADGTFDFVLFSFNGLDNVKIDSRLMTLREIRRVLKSGGWFCFSGHNACWHGLYSLYGVGALGRYLRQPRLLFEQMLFQVSLRLANRRFSMKAILDSIGRTGSGSFVDSSGYRQCYVSYDEQLRQLEQAGFNRMQAFSEGGAETAEVSALNAGYTIYYLARAA